MAVAHHPACFSTPDVSRRPVQKPRPGPSGPRPSAPLRGTGARRSRARRVGKAFGTARHARSASGSITMGYGSSITSGAMRQSSRQASFRSSPNRRDALPKRRLERTNRSHREDFHLSWSSVLIARGNSQCTHILPASCRDGVSAASLAVNRRWLLPAEAYAEARDTRGSDPRRQGDGAPPAPQVARPCHGHRGLRREYRRSDSRRRQGVRRCRNRRDPPARPRCRQQPKPSPDRTSDQHSPALRPTDGKQWLNEQGAAILAHENTHKHLLSAQRVEDWDYKLPRHPWRPFRRRCSPRKRPSASTALP